MASLRADGTHVVAAVVAEFAVHPREVDLAVGLAVERDIGDGDDAGARQATMAHQPPKRRPREQLEADERADGIARQPEDRGALETPEGEWLGRFDRDLHPGHVGDPAEHRLDHVVVAHRHATARHDRVAVDRRRAQHPLELDLVVADHTEIDHLTSALGQQRGQHRLVALADLTEL